MEVAPRRPQSAVMTRHTFWFLSLLVLPLAQATEVSSITVHLYDLAGVSNAILDPAVEIATRLYADAGVQLHWVRQTLPAGEPGQGPAFIPTATPTVVSLRLLRKHMSDRVVRPGSQKLGIAFPTGEGRFRYLASVFYDRVELAAAELTDLPLPVLLGHIMAHELGHLLLGPDAHARNTIMACPWDTTEIPLSKTRPVWLQQIAERHASFPVGEAAQSGGINRCHPAAPGVSGERSVCRRPKAGRDGKPRAA